MSNVFSRRTFLAGLGATSMAALLAGCGSSQQPQTDSSSTTADESAGKSEGSSGEQTDYKYDFVTKLKKSEKLYADASATPGSVESMTYTCPSYTIEAVDGITGTSVNKTLYVYLPNGYDSSKQYDIMYLLHGTGDNEGYWLTSDGINKGASTCNLLDMMHDKALCPDTIIVTPCYYSIPDGYTINTALEGGDDPYADEWPMYFWQELRNDIIPLVEARYSTYAGGDVSEDSLRASRDHRAFSGLSRGSMTSINSAMMHCLDYFSWIGSYSGAWADFDTFKSTLDGEYADYPVKFWYNGNGTADFSLDNHQEFVGKALEQMPDRFRDGDNYAWVCFDGGTHSYNCWILDLYNSLLAFFQ